MLTFVVQDQGKLILELVTFNQRTYKSIEDLNTRLQSLESATTSGAHPQRRMERSLASPFEPTSGHHDNARSRSPSPHRQDYRVRDEPGRLKKNKDKRSLQISIPGKMYTAPNASLPTPMTLSVCLLWVELRPVRLDCMNPRSDKKYSPRSRAPQILRLLLVDQDPRTVQRSQTRVSTSAAYTTWTRWSRRRTLSYRYSRSPIPRSSCISSILCAAQSSHCASTHVAGVRQL